MESKKKKHKIPDRKSKIQSETSDNDDSYAEDGDEDEDYGTENDDQCTEDSDECTEDDGSISSDNAEEHLSAEFDFDFMADVVKVLEDHAEVNMDNSIVLNRKLQDMLEGLKRKIVSMVNKCREIYQENQVKLANPTTMTSYLKGIGSCGRPFFKDSVGRFCPPNADYKYRSEVEKELFPSDLELFPHFTWTNRDKIGILQGIKEQAIEYLERKNSYEQKLLRSKPTALNKKTKLHSLKLKKLLDKVDSDFAIDWNQISVYNLGSRHTENSCLAQWNACLKPEINRDEWTEEENIKLNELAKKYRFQDWIAIASEMPNRSDYQCFVQYQTVVSIKMREDKGERWSKEEDDLLLSLVEKHKVGNVIRWNPIFSQLPHRTKPQCFARWKYSINPSILRAPFTPLEDCIILAAVEEFGENFNCFPKDLFPNRTVVQIRNRYNNSLKNNGKTRPWTPEDDKLLLDQVAKHGEHDWTRISANLEGHTRNGCRTRYITISKFLKDNPNTTIQDIPRKKRNSRSNVTKSNWVETITGLKEKSEQQEQVEMNYRDLYRYKLRNNELQWYNFLKYSYDFEFGEGYSKVPKCLTSLEFVRYVFQCKLKMPVVLQGHYAKSFVSVSLEKLIKLHDQSDESLVLERPDVGFKLPPSYNTLLAFRGLCIQASFNDQQDTNELSENVGAARNMFRQRLVSLLYKTTLLSRFEPNASVEHKPFEAINNIKSQLGQIVEIDLAELKAAQTKKIANNLLIAQKKAEINRQYKAKLEKTSDRGMDIELNKKDGTTSKTVTTSSTVTKTRKKPNQKTNINKKTKTVNKFQTEKVSEQTVVKQKPNAKQQHEINLIDSSQQKSSELPEVIIKNLENYTQSKLLKKPEEILIKLEKPPRSMTEEESHVYENLEVNKQLTFATQDSQEANRKRPYAEELLVEGECFQSPAAAKIAIEYIERKDSYKQKLHKSKPTALSKKVKLHSLKLKKLLDKVDADFAIDWNQISVFNLGSRHTANSCLASWNIYLKPEINRDEWTEKENFKLNELAKKYRFQDWIAIASEMPHRSDYQCFVQYQTVVSIKMREDKGERWSKEEDDLLLTLVEKYRMGNVIRWNPICSQLPNRTKKQCFARWKYSINPNISRALFTPVEDCIILAAVEEFGENFNCFPKDLFPNRTVIQIRNRYNNSIKNRATTRHWTPEDDQLLLDQVAKYGEHDWTRTSEKIEGHTRTSCRTRYLTISKFLKDNPNATIQDIPRKKRNSRSNVTKSNWVETIAGIAKNGTLQEQEPTYIAIRNNNKQLYRSKLRNNELQWYNFFKYSYDFNFGESYSKVPKCLASLEFVRCVFECKLDKPVVLSGHYATGFVPVTLQKLVRLHDQGDESLVLERPDVEFKLPPSYSTLLAFRGLCIQVSFNGQQEKTAAITNELSENVLAARNMFHQRLVSLLCKTTLLSRLEPKTSVEHNKFEVIYDVNSRLGQIASINVAQIKVAQTKKIAENILIAQNKAYKKRQYKTKLEKTAERNLKRNHKTYVNKKAKNINKAQPEINLKDVGYSFQSKSSERPEEIIIELEGAPQSESLEKREEILIHLEMSPGSMTEELPAYEKLEVTLKSNRKRRLEESLECWEESSQSQPLESPVATKIVKYEYE